MISIRIICLTVLLLEGLVVPLPGSLADEKTEGPEVAALRADLLAKLDAGVSQAKKAAAEELASEKYSILETVKAQVDDLRNITKALPNNSDSGVVYTIWGKKTCGEGAKNLYIGFMAGATQIGGGGAGYLCLPNTSDVTYKKTNDKLHTSRIGGIQFRLEAEQAAKKLWTLVLNDDEDRIETQINYHDLMCAVCYRPGKSNQLMVPGTTKCLSNEHILEYGGHLVAARSDDINNKHTSEYVCLSSTLQTRSGGEVDTPASGEVVPTLLECTSLNCPPYQTGAEIPCTVCTL